MLRTEINKSRLSNHICQHRGMKTSTVTPSFYYVFNISLYCNDTIPSFIGNLWRLLLLGNHLNYFLSSCAWAACGFIGYPSTSNFVKNTPLRVVFSTLFSVFGYPDETLSLVFATLLAKLKNFVHVICMQYSSRLYGNSVILLKIGKQNSMKFIPII